MIPTIQASLPPMQNLISDLTTRGLIQDIMPGTADQLLKESTAGYIGFDPTADSLHVGSLLPITLLMRLQRAGHTPIALVGGATGMIGDPSGKSAERNLLSAETIAANCAGIRTQLEHFLDFDAALPNPARLVNNYDWFGSMGFLDFIRDAGKHITVSYMMSKDSVQKRLETGLSFTEFTYQLIQGYDFYHLNKNADVKLQMGGADQWGNIVTGTETHTPQGWQQCLCLYRAAYYEGRWQQVWQKRGGQYLAECGAHQPLPLLPVLAGPARCRCTADEPHLLLQARRRNCRPGKRA